MALPQRKEPYDERLNYEMRERPVARRRTGARWLWLWLIVIGLAIWWLWGRSSGRHGITNMPTPATNGGTTGAAGSGNVTTGPPGTGVTTGTSGRGPSNGNTPQNGTGNAAGTNPGR